MGTKPGGERKHPKEKTPTFLLELPLAVEAGQAARLRAHLEAGRQFYNAVLSAGQRRLRQMRADPAQAGRPAPSPGHTRRSGELPSRLCGSATAFQSTPFTTSLVSCGSRGWLTTWMPCWLRRLLPRLSSPQSRLRGGGPSRALQESRTRPFQHRKQAQRYRLAFCARNARRRESRLSDLERRPASGPD